MVIERFIYIVCQIYLAFRFRIKIRISFYLTTHFVLVIIIYPSFPLLPFPLISHRNVDGIPVFEKV